MQEYCIKHSDRKALSFCQSCKKYYCEECLGEGAEYYYCKEKKCIEALEKEKNVYAEVRESIESELPKILIEGKAITFCDKCIDETIDQEVRVGYFSQNHSKLTNERNICNTCGSVMMDLKLGLLPFVPFQSTQGTYRIIKSAEFDPGYLYLHRDKFLSRKLKI